MKYLFTKKEINEMLVESNAIENVYSKDALIDAQKAWDYLVKQKVLTEEVVLKTHGILMKRRPLSIEAKGAYRKCKVWIGGREGLEWTKIPKTMKQWIKNVNDLIQNGKREPVSFLDKMTKEHHIAFEKIHPYQDGNGRMRILYNWERLQLGLPIHIIHEGDEQWEYYQWFR